MGARLICGLALVACGACSGSSDDQQYRADSGRDGSIDSDSGDVDDVDPDDASTEDDSGADAATQKPGIDAGSDAGPDASDTFEVSLSASVLNVTSSAPVFLTAGAVNASSVTFYEGSTELGTDDDAPFEWPLTFSYFDNGDHTYTAQAVTGGDTLTSSNSLTLTVNVPANGVFVDPQNGLDTADGSEANPLRTILKASQTATVGQNVYLLAGTYDSTNQTSGYQATFAKDVAVWSVPDAGVTLTGTGNGFWFTDGGSIEGVTFDGLSTGVSVYNGVFQAANLRFRAVGLPFYARGAARVTLDERGVDDVVTNAPSTGFGNSFLTVDNTAEVTVLGGTISDLTAPGGVGVFFARGAGKLTIDGTTVRNVTQRAVTVYDNGNVVAKNATFDTIKPGESGQNHSAFVLGGQNTAQPIDTRLELDHTSIVNTVGNAIGWTLYGNMASKPVLVLKSADISNNGGAGVWIAGVAGLSPNLVVTVTAEDTTIRDNDAAGFTSPLANMTWTGGALSDNGAGGLRIDALSNAGVISTLTMRDAQVSGNGADGVYFAGAATSTLDLGTAGDAGGNVFVDVAATFSALRLVAAIPASAVGNQWVANQQGANGTGNYTTSTTVTGASSGTNVNAAAGASVVLAP